MGREEFSQPVATTTTGTVDARRDHVSTSQTVASSATSGSAFLGEVQDCTLLLDVSGGVDINLFVTDTSGAKYEIDESPISFSSAGKKVVKFEYDGAELIAEAADGATTFSASIHYTK